MSSYGTEELKKLRIRIGSAAAVRQKSDAFFVPWFFELTGEIWCARS